MTEAILNLIDSFHRRGRAFSLYCFLHRTCTASERFRCSFRPSEFTKKHLPRTEWMMNFADSDEQVRPDRLTEIGGLLAQALMRLQSRKSSAILREFGESSLHFTPDQSGHAKPVSPEVNA
ncbi:hypothetical protein [Bradyrhizobium sp. URHD0069]|uniref:hypothetical protein n=1 Tax=Bradyrhizobium sp. URHD0069 TaxID=1380355 RepID=UPI0012DBDD03|nr:hypothetical protein [Bradyrhizobium sp. URHD0069]